MKTITKLIVTLLLMSITLFANTPNLNKLQQLVKKVEQNERIVLALDDAFPARNTLTIASKNELIKQVRTSVKSWKVSYREMNKELREVSNNDNLEKKLVRYKERVEILQVTSAEYRAFMRESKEAILTSISNYWKENLKVKTWYIDMQNGSNTNDGLSDTTAFERFEHLVELNSIIAGDTILIMGEYANENFGDGDVWKTNTTISLVNLHGTANKYITIKPYDVNTVLKGDSGTIFRILNSSYIQVEGFTIEGEVQNISIATAKEYQFIYKNEKGTIKYRVKEGTSNEDIAKMKFELLPNIQRPSYTDTKGLYVSDSNHINIVGNTISYMPGTGLRVAKSDYINIVENEVDHCSMRSYSGTHALVVHSSLSGDKTTGYKIKILRNRVHHNYNEIFSWSPSKTIITPHIDEGKGISLQKNIPETGWKHGRILVANNVAYNNGFSGITNNGGERIDIFNNTCYMNSQSSIKGKNIGISSSGGKDINITNNIIQSDLNHVGYAISVTDNKKLTVFNNLVKGKLDNDLDASETQTIMGEPRFVDAENFDFRLQSDSDAQDIAKVLKAVPFDMGGDERHLETPDMGAWED
jgi:parallel beta-helix repeat protein